MTTAAVEHPTRKERVARGKAAREESPRERHAEWSTAQRKQKPLDLLAEQGTTRVPELVPIRYGRMAATPFTYYRGAALPMAADLSTGPRTSIDVQLCGDAHLCNFGGFASPERDLLFDVNDFDETSGTLRMGSQALGRQPGNRRPQPGLSGQDWSEVGHQFDERLSRGHA